MKESDMNQDLVKLIIQHPSLLKLVITLHDLGGALPTRKLLLKMKQWGRGQALIKLAKKEGLIKRKTIAAEGKGNNQVVNILTEKGKQLVKLYNELQS